MTSAMRNAKVETLHEVSGVGNTHEKRRAVTPPLILHVVHRFAIGGLENVIVNLVNFSPPDRYRHAIVSLTDYTNFRQRIQRNDVPVFALHKRAGHDLGIYGRFWRLLRELQPVILHTYNFPTLEFAVIAALARVPGRIHAEHGRDVFDIDGSNTKYRLFRQLARPFVHRYVAVSDELTRWLTKTIGIPTPQVTHIYNGVDPHRFTPRTGERNAIGPAGFADAESFIIGTVGRMQTVKNQMLLARAFVRLLTLAPALHSRLRLVLVGDGPLREECRRILHEGNVEHLAWLAGERDDIPEILRSLDIFVLPSLTEGISCTILEAMASGVAVLATQVGGNAELVKTDRTGVLLPPEDPEAMATMLLSYVTNPQRAKEQGRAGREQVEKEFSVNVMVEKYLAMYDSLHRRQGLTTAVNS